MPTVYRDKYPFNGDYATVEEVGREATAFPLAAIQSALEAGNTTMASIVMWIENRDRIRLAKMRAASKPARSNVMRKIRSCVGGKRMGPVAV